MKPAYGGQRELGGGTKESRKATPLQPAVRVVSPGNAPTLTEQQPAIPHALRPTPPPRALSPSSWLSQLMVALSVSTSQYTSPGATESPT